MKAKQRKASPKPKSIYGLIHKHMLSTITPMIEAADKRKLNGEAASPKADDLDIFSALAEVLHQNYTIANLRNERKTNHPLTQALPSGLRTVHQFLVRAWYQNARAKYFLDGKAVAQGVPPRLAMTEGVMAAMRAAQALAQAKTLLASNPSKIAQKGGVATVKAR